MKKEFIASNGSILRIESFNDYIQIKIPSELSDKFVLDLSSPHDKKEVEILIQSLMKILKKNNYNPCLPWERIMKKFLTIDELRTMTGEIKSMDEFEKESLAQAVKNVASWPQWKKDAYRVIDRNYEIITKESGGGGRPNIKKDKEQNLETIEDLHKKIKELEEENSKLKNELASIKGYR